MRPGPWPPQRWTPGFYTTPWDVNVADDGPGWRFTTPLIVDGVVGVVVSALRFGRSIEVIEISSAIRATHDTRNGAGPEGPAPSFIKLRALSCRL